MEIGVIEVASGLSTTLVASSLPPRPVSKQQQIGRRLGEGEEGRGGGDLEQGDQLAGIGGLGAGEAIHQHRFADGRRAIGAGKHDALMEVDEMRRGVDMHALAQRLRHGADEGDQRALAVGAGDMNHRRQARSGWPRAASSRSMRPSDRSMDCGCSALRRSSSVTLAETEGSGMRPSSLWGRVVKGDGL